MNNIYEERSEKFHDILEVALLENKCEFVILILEQDVNLGQFLNQNRLKALYNNEAVRIKILREKKETFDFLNI
jgi:hypothetical protein